MKIGKTYKENLGELLISFTRWVNNNENYYSSLAKIISVDETEKTCVVEIIDGAELEDVRLEQVSSEEGFLIIPSVDSIVIISWTDKTSAYVSMYSQIDRIIFQNGTNGGLTITPDLVTELDKTNSLLTALINIINGPPIPEPGNGDPSAFQSALSGALAGQQLGDYSNIENENFLH